MGDRGGACRPCARRARPSSMCAFRSGCSTRRASSTPRFATPSSRCRLREYLKTLGPNYPKTLEQLIERAQAVTSPRADGAGPNPTRWSMFARELASGSMDDYRYLARARSRAAAGPRRSSKACLPSQSLDAIVYPTSSRRPDLIAAPPETPGGASASATNIANLTGFPDLIVPAGFTADGLPVGLSFLGRRSARASCWAWATASSKRTRARRRPVHTPALPGETVSESRVGR